jgi:hypothetical protein
VTSLPCPRTLPLEWCVAGALDRLGWLSPGVTFGMQRHGRPAPLNVRVTQRLEDVPVVVELWDGGRWCDGYTVTAIAASWVGGGASC